MNEVAPPRIARVTPTSFPELFSLENKRGSVTVIWACPRLGHSQNPSHDMGILCNPNSNRKGFWEWRCPKRGDAHAMSLYHSNTTPPISQRKKTLGTRLGRLRGWKRPTVHTISNDGFCQIFGYKTSEIVPFKNS